MRQLSYLGNRRLRLEDIEPPALEPGQVRIAVDSVGLCKSDVYGYCQLNDRRDAVLRDGDVLVMGHEPAGPVQELGPGVDGPDPGTPVAVNPIFGCGAAPAARWERATCASDGR
jgi:threonine dehydrogenase-like Zn-dependent dehydrogenase